MSNSPIAPQPLPPQALLARYAGTGAYTDCFAADVNAQVTLADYVAAFYSGRLFRLERWLLAVAVRRPSTDAQVAQLAAGTLQRFAAWDVEARNADQLLLCDMAQRTRSWLMVAPRPDGQPGTRLYFGSAVVPLVDRSTGRQRMGWGFHALMGFHKLYSRALLGAAQARVQRAASG